MPQINSVFIQLALVPLLWLPDARAAEVTFPDESWEYRMAPQERADLGLDSGLLETWVAPLAAFPANTGMIIRDGYVVAEWGEIDDGLQGWVSTWKSQVGMAAFLAHSEGLMLDFEAPVRPLVQAAFGIDLIGKDRPITFGDLGRNISGYGRIEAPGQAFAYADASPNLASELVAEAVASTGASGWFSYMLEKLDPSDGSGIQFEDFFFPTRRSTRDAARLAWLWANAGRWDDQQLIPQSYFSQYVKPLTPFGLPQSSATEPVNGDYLSVGGITIDANYQTQGAYGFWWYFNNRPVTKPRDANPSQPTRKLPGLPHDAFTAYGTGGKYMIAIPSLRMAVAINAYFGNDWSGLMDAVVDLDRTPPTPISGLAALHTSSSTVMLEWDTATDVESGVDKYWIYRDGAWIGETSSPCFTDSGLMPEQAYQYQVQAFNADGYATDLSPALPASTTPAPPIFSVNFGSSVIGLTEPIPRSADFIAGMEKAPWWNNHFFDPGFWRDTGQSGVWILSNGSEATGLELRVTSPNVNDATTVIYASTQTNGPTPDSRNLRLHTDSYVNTASYNQVGVDIRNLPAEFQHGWNLYVATHYSHAFAYGIYQFNLDLGRDGSVDRTLYSLHQPSGDWLDSTLFANPSQSNTLANVGTQHSSYIVFRGIPNGQDNFALTVTNLSGSSRKASINAIQVEALEEPVNYPLWKAFFDWPNNESSLPDANPDGDPLVNLLEYTYATHPLQPESFHSPNLTLSEVNGSQWYCFDYRLNSRAFDLHSAIEYSDDLIEWTPLIPNGVDIIQETLVPDIDGDGSAARIRTRLLYDTHAGDLAFFRNLFQLK